MGSLEKEGIGNAWPVGFGFRPTDDELIYHHLTRKLRGLKENGRVIPELNIYHWEPQNLFQMYNDMSEYPSDGGECFFYSTKNGNNRMTKSGYWKETRNKRTLLGCDGEEIGSKRILVYYEGRQPRGKKSIFSMHEYHLNCCTDPEIRIDQGPAKEFLLCRIIKRKIKMIKLDSPSKCLEPDLVTPGCTAANQGDKDIEASSQICDPQTSLTEAEAEAGGHGDCSEMNLLIDYGPICSQLNQFTGNDQFDGLANYTYDDPDEGVSIAELWDWQDPILS